MSDTEQRWAALRADDSGVTATLIRFDDEAKIGDFTERFAAGAISPRDDLIANLQHDRMRPVARTGAGLTLATHADRIDVRIDWPETQYAREAAELVNAGIVRGLSMEFRADNEQWAGRARTITGATLFGLALVDRPAYPGSVIHKRWSESTVARTRKIWL